MSVNSINTVICSILFAMSVNSINTVICSILCSILFAICSILFAMSVNSINTVICSILFAMSVNSINTVICSILFAMSVNIYVYIRCSILFAMSVNIYVYIRCSILFAMSVNSINTVICSILFAIFSWTAWSVEGVKVHLDQLYRLIGGFDQLIQYTKKFLPNSNSTFLEIKLVSVMLSLLIALVLFIVMGKVMVAVIGLVADSFDSVEVIVGIILVMVIVALVMMLLVMMERVLVIYISSNRNDSIFKEMVAVKSLVQNMRWYHIFGLLWFTEFVIACQHMVIAGSIAQWYFTRDKGNLSWPILTSSKRLVRYHLGSVALGSLIIAIVKFIRLLLKRVEKWLTGKFGEGCSWALKICQCCLWCFEKFLKFLNRNAYIEIAIYGYSFCKAARQAFTLLINNAFRVAAINSVGAFVLFLAKAAVVVSTVFIGIEIMKSRPEVTYMWVPILLSAIIAYLLAHCFISVYEMTIDTLFLCFCEDCERNDGVQRPYYMSKGLME
ncbi:unnamed protein product, partial [Meganyctiphanes norvegica]